MDYYKRIADIELTKRLNSIGATLIVGPKLCGKTTTASQQAKSILRLNDPDVRDQYLLTAGIKPSLLLKGETPRLIDEWQEAPSLWDSVRVSVDKIGKPGLYILTGSTTVKRENIHHSGTGRISTLKMYPMSLYESHESNGLISLSELFNNKDLDIDGIHSDLDISSLIFACCRGGWPSTLFLSANSSKLFIAKDYVNHVCEVDMSSLDNIQRRPSLTRTLLKSYARNISTLASNKTILDDINANEYMSESTYYEYLDALKRLYLIEDLEAWSPQIRSKSSMRSSNKREFTDPSIAVASLNLSPEYLETDLKTFGFIFECLCIRDLKVYSTPLGGRISYYHDRFGLEVDAVLHLEDGRYALIEFKLGSKQIEEGASHLLKVKKLIQKHNEEVSSSNSNNNNNIIREPDLLIVITGGNISYTRDDSVKVIPIGCLKD